MSLRIVPLGGLGEIGLNAMVVELDGRRLLIDCGLLFPRLDRSLGFEIYVPDLAYLSRDFSSLDGVVLTHGHEDHLGALPLLLRAHRVPVWGGPFSLALLQSRLAEMNVEADLRPMKDGTRFAVGAFDVESVHVNHSIPDASGLIVRTERGTIVHSGDFKIDPTPFDGRPTDLAAFARAGKEGVVCLLSDSTNAERPGTTVSELEVGRTLETVIGNAPGRVIITHFASHLIRLQQLIQLAAKLNRKIVPFGRSLVSNLRLGSDLGHLVGAGAVTVPVESLDRLPEREVLLVVSGAQGEPQSALSRMARDPNAPARIRAGDTVVFSARAIPGNEIAIGDLVNRLWELGATVITDDNHGASGPVHTSGHASQDEQRQLIEAVRPATLPATCAWPGRARPHRSACWHATATSSTWARPAPPTWSARRPSARWPWRSAPAPSSPKRRSRPAPRSRRAAWSPWCSRSSGPRVSCCDRRS